MLAVIVVFCNIKKKQQKKKAIINELTSLAFNLRPPPHRPSNHTKAACRDITKLSFLSSCSSAQLWKEWKKNKEGEEERGKKKSILHSLIKGQDCITWSRPGRWGAGFFFAAVFMQGNMLAWLAFIWMCDLFNTLSTGGVGGEERGGGGLGGIVFFHYGERDFFFPRPWKCQESGGV